MLFFSGSRLNLKERVRTACGNLVVRHQKFIDRHGTPATHSGGMPPAPAGADSDSQGVERSATPGNQFHPDSALRPERQLSVGNALRPECGWIGHPSPGVALRFTPWLPDGLPPEDSKVWSSRFEFNRWLAEKSNPQSRVQGSGFRVFEDQEHSGFELALIVHCLFNRPSISPQKMGTF